MRTLLAVLTLFAALPLAAQAPEPPKAQPVAFKGVVRPQVLNVRIEPFANGGIVAKLPRGTEVQIVGVEGAWYKIVLPESAAAYVAAGYVKDGKTIARVQMRYGAGIEYHSYGVIPADFKVEVIGDAEHPNWLRIKPPQGMFHAYVASQLVAISEADYAKLVGDENAVPPHQREIAPVGKAANATMADMAERFEFMRAFFTAPPEDITLRGEVLKTDAATTGAAHALVQRTDGKSSVIAILYHGKVDWESWGKPEVKVAKDEAAVNLAELIGKQVEIKGKKLTVPSWSYPYIVVEEAKIK